MPSLLQILITNSTNVLQDFRRNNRSEQCLIFRECSNAYEQNCVAVSFLFRLSSDRRNSPTPGSFFQSTSINLDFGQRLSAPSTFLVSCPFFSFVVVVVVVVRELTVVFLFCTWRTRVHARHSRPLGIGTAHNYSSGSLPNSRSLITVFERRRRSGPVRSTSDRRFKLFY